LAPIVRRFALVALATLGFVTSGGCMGGSSGVAAPVLRVSAAEMKFSPTALAAAANKRSVIVIKNTGAISHTFSLNDLGLEVKIPPGAKRQVTVKAAAGHYPYVCRILDHEGLGMVGQLTIT
jgi:uncharacterized cupredoxin-like copper-binding protein